MKTITIILLATGLAAAIAGTASAQSGNVTVQGAAAVSAATHCKNAQGQVELKRTGRGAGGVATTGSAAGPSGSGGSKGTAASSAPGGMGTDAPAVTLSPC